MFAVILVTNVNITSLIIKLEKNRKQIWNADSLGDPVVSIIFQFVDFDFFFPSHYPVALDCYLLELFC